MNDSNSLQIPTESQLGPLQIMQPTAAPIGKLLETVISKGVTSENVGALEKLMDLYERMQNKDAERQFNAAFVELKREMPMLIADRSVPDRDGNTKFRFAAFEYIMGKLEPLMMKHGFTVTFSMAIEGGTALSKPVRFLT